jgi:hypothetical protein
MAATAHSPRPSRLRSVKEGAARLIPPSVIGAYVAHPDAEAGEGR